MFFEGFNIPTIIVFSFKSFISFSDGQLTLIIKLLNLKTALEEALISTPNSLKILSSIPK